MNFLKTNYSSVHCRFMFLLQNYSFFVNHRFSSAAKDGSTLPRLVYRPIHTGHDNVKTTASVYMGIHLNMWRVWCECYNYFRCVLKPARPACRRQIDDDVFSMDAHWGSVFGVNVLCVLESVRPFDAVKLTWTGTGCECTLICANVNILSLQVTRLPGERFWVYVMIIAWWGKTGAFSVRTKFTWRCACRLLWWRYAGWSIKNSMCWKIKTMTNVIQKMKSDIDRRIKVDYFVSWNTVLKLIKLINQII